MKTTLITLATTLLATATPVFAGSNPVDGEMGLLGILFLGFGALIIAFQLVPAIMLLVAMVKGVFAAANKATAASDAK